MFTKPSSIKFFLTGLIFLILFNQMGCQNNSPGEISIRLKWLHQAQFAGFYYAKEAALYKNRGLKVTLRPGGIDYPAIQMVASGSDNFGVTGADQILIAREKGIPVVAVACIYRISPFVLFSLQESKITKVEDFKGKRIGVKLGGNEELTYRTMLKSAGLSNTQVTEVPVKFDISLLLTKKVDVWPGYSINEPITAEEKGFPVNLIWPHEYGIHMYADVLFTTEKMIKTQPKIVEAVVKATLEGWSKAFEDKDLAVKYTLKYGKGLTYEHEMKMLSESHKLIIPDNKPIGWMDNTIWLEMKKLLRDNNFIKKDIEVSKAYKVKYIYVE